MLQSIMAAGRKLYVPRKFWPNVCSKMCIRDRVRGVDSSSTIQKLAQKGLVEEAGRLDLPGKPISFRTTDVFLRTFGLKSLADLPPLHEDDYPLEAIAAGAQEQQIDVQEETT